MKHQLRAARIAVTLAGLAALGAHAETSPYYIGSSLSYAHQSNVLGLADGEELGANLQSLGYSSKSDDVTSLALVGGFDQQISRQRVFGDLTLRNNRYAHNDLLNNNSYALTTGLDWQTVNRLSGTVKVRANRDLIHYSSVDQPSGQKNLISTRQADLTARLGGVTALTIEGGAGYRSVNYSDSTYDSNEYSQAYGSLGVRYWPSGLTSVGLSIRETEGKYPHFAVDTSGQSQADNFSRQDIDLSTSVELSGATNLSARLSHTKIEYDFRGDFSGFTGQLGVNYQATGALHLQAEFARDRGQDLRFVFFSPDAELVQAETASLTTIWRTQARYDLTAKTSLNAGLSYTRRPIALNITNPDSTTSQGEGHETRRQYSLGVSWAPTRTSQVGCSVSRERRKSDAVEELNLSSNVTSCYAQLTLQP